MPTTEDILRYFVAPPYKIDPQREDEDFAAWLSRISIESMHSQMASERAARRWLAQHDAEMWERGWLTVDVEHRDGVGDINPISGEPIRTSIHSRPEED